MGLLEMTLNVENREKLLININRERVKNRIVTGLNIKKFTRLRIL